MRREICGSRRVGCLKATLLHGCVSIVHTLYSTIITLFGEPHSWSLTSPTSGTLSNPVLTMTPAANVRGRCGPANYYYECIAGCS